MTRTCCRACCCCGDRGAEEGTLVIGDPDQGGDGIAANPVSVDIGGGGEDANGENAGGGASGAPSASMAPSLAPSEAGEGSGVSPTPTDAGGMASGDMGDAEGDPSLMQAANALQARLPEVDLDLTLPTDYLVYKSTERKHGTLEELARTTEQKRYIAAANGGRAYSKYRLSMAARTMCVNTNNLDEYYKAIADFIILATNNKDRVMLRFGNRNLKKPLPSTQVILHKTSKSVVVAEQNGLLDMSNVDAILVGPNEFKQHQTGGSMSLDDFKKRKGPLSHVAELARDTRLKGPDSDSD